MLYIEFLSLTDGKATYEQFVEIEAAYMSREKMTKQQAVSLWKRRYSPKKQKPLAKELREIKQAICDFRREKEWAEVQEERIRKKYAEEIAQFDPESAWEKHIIEALEKRRNSAIWTMWEDMGNDTTIQIIYEDGSQCVASGTEIVSGDIIPTMQHIVYACYQDGYTEYDTLTGCLDEHFGDLSEDAEMEAREQYFGGVEIKFGTEWGRRHAKQTS